MHTPDDSVSYFTTRAFDKALQNAMLSGGEARKRSDRARIVLGSLRDPNPFATLQATNNGETRIDNCVKYDLGGAWRLVTRQADKTCTFLFIGDHEDTQRWIAAHKGENIGVKDRRLIRVPGTSADPTTRPVLAEQHQTPLVEMLDTEASNYLLSSLPPNLILKFGALDGGCRPGDLNQLTSLIPNPKQAEVIHQVFCLLLDGNIDGAQAHIDLSMGRIAPIEDLDSKDILEISDGEEVRRLRVGSTEYEDWLKAFEQRSTWHDWFLFLHPEQEAIVNADYSGVSQLSGVSGSGKTCVAVRRAIRLARDPQSKVLLLTLNRSLAGLLTQLVDVACLDAEIRSRISVISFFELARDMLMQFEPDNSRHYEDVTWKSGEHVDEIFREYYRCWVNNNDAAPLLALQKTCNVRSIAGEAYLRQEFDWIRSAVQPNKRTQYLSIDRKGRRFPIVAERRSDLLLGLSGWETKMRAVGVIDYLGLTSALANHTSKIVPMFTNILVDEAQDFGTTELSIVRMLAAEGPNDIFLCGDIAQTILPKHRQVIEAGLRDITKERIRRNYRNSREILAAAYDLLKQNLHEELFESSDLEILDPKFSSFCGPVPVALAAETLAEEIAYARSYAETHLSLGTRNLCIAFAGYSSRDVKKYAAKCKVTALDGAYHPSTDRLVFSDLEQTKGYEFDVLIVVNCCGQILPARDAPVEEAFRDICKLYVAMTRAKRELVLSYHGSASEWIKAVSTSISADDWQAIEHLNDAFVQDEPQVLSEIDPNTHNDDSISTNGSEFLYTSNALGLSLDAQEKLAELVDGKGLLRGGSRRRLKWTTVRSLLSDLTSNKMYDGLLGSNVADEIRSKLGHFSSPL